MDQIDRAFRAWQGVCRLYARQATNLADSTELLPKIIHYVDKPVRGENSVAYA